MCNEISFIHVSDIHFNRYSGDDFDDNDDLRNEMIRDIEKNAKKELRNVKGILVCGDIAFSGQEAEYDIAEKFLKNILNIFDLSEKDIYCVPGNHDIDQNVPKQSISVYNAQKLIEDQKIDDVDLVLRKFKNDKLIENPLLYPIKEYNKFSNKLSSSFDKMQLYWQSEIKLNSKYNLIIHGINSAIISNSDDHKYKTKERKMVITQTQIPQNKDGNIYMVLCHHPPECWKDNDILEKLMHERVKIQLYGHKHLQKIEVDEKSLKISSGAIHPERDDNWIPCYNWISIKVEKDKLIIKVYPRILNDVRVFTCDKKVCESNIYKLVTLDLDLDEDDSLGSNFESEEKDINILNTHDNEYSEQDLVDSEKEIRKTNITDKEIVYKYLCLNNINKEATLKRCLHSDEIDKNKLDDVDYILQIIKKNSLEDEFLNILNEYY
ncbi:metallophosphoesterase family protein [Clostridium beijerinckii]|uniref:3',5'-cyclic adenosine monophosphate phosphodiesterase CpdA n=1 Tax=Clostridium beijerinckii TaxID=1520 RepID=A0A1S8S2S5_CLOBE|nr:metallophosphoesterase family protein [Clostridium beijerinckii]NRY63289.1 putative phosphodiesterase [Clostridium beijerinckii]OOM59729.1 3',5'-cyclic adenosine monophosphate phosphodiesterase CpdA [Clostridium beijerinckii]